MIYREGNKVFRRYDQELLSIEPWGDNSFRVRATELSEFRSEDYSALLSPESCDVKVKKIKNSTVIINGKIKCEIIETGKLKFYNQKDELLLEEYDRNRMRENIVGE